MQSLGYNVDSNILCAADYGSLQKRKRAIIIGTEQSIEIVLLPSPTYCENINLLGLKPYF